MILLFSTPTRLHNSSLVLRTSVLYYHADACLLWKRKFLLITPQIHVDEGIKIILITWINISKRLPRPVLFNGLCKISFKAVFVIYLKNAVCCFLFFFHRVNNPQLLLHLYKKSPAFKPVSKIPLVWSMSGQNVEVVIEVLISDYVYWNWIMRLVHKTISRTQSC